MQALLDDLVDFNRTRLGLGLRIVKSDVDLAAVAANELEQLRAAHANRRIELEVRGDTRGEWDGRRVQQLLRNLVLNAIQHGSPDAIVHLAVKGEPHEIVLEVESAGPTIDPKMIDQLFDPLKRIPSEESDSQRSPSERLGLGLFIVRAIASAHEGDAEMRSRDGKTTVIVRLPRQEPMTSRSYARGDMATQPFVAL
jgi:signal transduction histidine kinase